MKYERSRKYYKIVQRAFVNLHNVRHDIAVLLNEIDCVKLWVHLVDYGHIHPEMYEKTSSSYSSNEEIQYLFQEYLCHKHMADEITKSNYLFLEKGVEDNLSANSELSYLLKGKTKAKLNNYDRIDVIAFSFCDELIQWLSSVRKSEALLARSLERKNEPNILDLELSFDYFESKSSLLEMISPCDLALIQFFSSNNKDIDLLMYLHSYLKFDSDDQKGEIMKTALSKYYPYHDFGHEDFDATYKLLSSVIDEDNEQVLDDVFTRFFIFYLDLYHKALEVQKHNLNVLFILFNTDALGSITTDIIQYFKKQVFVKKIQKLYDKFQEGEESTKDIIFCKRTNKSEIVRYNNGKIEFDGILNNVFSIPWTLNMIEKLYKALLGNYISNETDYRSLVSIITGHKIKNHEFKQIDWIDNEIGSLAVFVGILRDVHKKTTSKKMSWDVAKASFLYKGENINSKLSTLYSQAKKKGSYSDLLNIFSRCEMIKDELLKEILK